MAHAGVKALPIAIPAASEPNAAPNMLAINPDSCNRSSQTPARAGHPQVELVEPLSPRELDILRLIAQGLSNQEIGARLFLALNTIKGHNRVIFEKLQVERRTEAIARARELGLL